MIIQLVEVYKLKQLPKADQSPYSLRDVFISTEHITCLREDLITSKNLQSGLLPEELDSRQRFTKIHLNRGLSGIDLTVVGDPSTIQKKLSGKTLLKG